MGTTYEKARPETLALLAEVQRQHHADLDGVTFAVLMAANKKGPALKAHGHPALAKVRIVSLRDRAKNMADAEILIDEEHWLGSSEAEHAAILDHELTHLERVQKRERSDGGDDTEVVYLPKVDDLGRPKLKLRPHDVQFGWFDIVAQRHGLASVERKQLEAFIDERGQVYLPGLAIPGAKKLRAAKAS